MAAGHTLVAAIPFSPIVDFASARDGTYALIGNGAEVIRLSGGSWTKVTGPIAFNNPIKFPVAMYADSSGNPKVIVARGISRTNPINPDTAVLEEYSISGGNLTNPSTIPFPPEGFTITKATRFPGRGGGILFSGIRPNEEVGFWKYSNRLWSLYNPPDTARSLVGTSGNQIITASTSPHLNSIGRRQASDNIFVTTDVNAPTWSSPINVVATGDHVPDIESIDGTRYVGRFRGTFGLWSISKIEFPPNTPTSLRAVADSSTQITTTWQAGGGATPRSWQITKVDPTPEEGYEVRANSRVWTGLNPNTTYCFVVAAKNNAGSSERTNKACAKTPPAPETPDGPTVTSTSDSVTVTTAAIAGATAYIFRRVSPGDKEEFSQTGNSRTFSSLQPDTLYCFDVAAEVGGERTSFSSRSCIQTQKSASEGPPVAPGSLTVTVDSGTQITTTWDAVGNAEEYIISLVSPSSESRSNIVSGLRWVWTGLKPNTEYCFGVSARNSGGTSGMDRRCGTTTSGPEVPTGLTATADKNRITTSWDSVTGADEYEISMTSPRNETNVVSGTTWTWTGLDSETRYCFVVRSRNSSGSSNQSAIACVTTGVAVEERPGFTPFSPTPEPDFPFSGSAINAKIIDDFGTDRILEICGRDSPGPRSVRIGIRAWLATSTNVGEDSTLATLGGPVVKPTIQGLPRSIMMTKGEKRTINYTVGTNETTTSVRTGNRSIAAVRKVTDSGLNRSIEITAGNRVGNANITVNANNDGKVTSGTFFVYVVGEPTIFGLPRSIYVAEGKTVTKRFYVTGEGNVTVSATDATVTPRTGNNYEISVTGRQGIRQSVITARNESGSSNFTMRVVLLTRPTIHGLRTSRTVGVGETVVSNFTVSDPSATVTAAASNSNVSVRVTGSGTDRRLEVRGVTAGSSRVTVSARSGDSDTTRATQNTTITSRQQAPEIYNLDRTKSVLIGKFSSGNSDLFSVSDPDATISVTQDNHNAGYRLVQDSNNPLLWAIAYYGISVGRTVFVLTIRNSAGRNTETVSVDSRTT